MEYQIKKISIHALDSLPIKIDSGWVPFAVAYRDRISGTDVWLYKVCTEKEDEEN